VGLAEVCELLAETTSMAGKKKRGFGRMVVVEEAGVNG